MAASGCFLDNKVSFNFDDPCLNHVTVAVSLYGDKPRYADGAQNLIRWATAKNEELAARGRLTLRVYHDASVPSAVLARLREQGCALVDMDVSANRHGCDFQGELRMMWRMLAFFDCDASVIADVDFEPCHEAATNALLRMPAVASPRLLCAPAFWNHGAFAPHVDCAGVGCWRAGPLLQAAGLLEEMRAACAARATMPRQSMASRAATGYGVDELLVDRVLHRMPAGTVCVFVQGPDDIDCDNCTADRDCSRCSRHWGRFRQRQEYAMRAAARFERRGKYTRADFASACPLRDAIMGPLPPGSHACART